MLSDSNERASWLSLTNNRPASTLKSLQEQPISNITTHGPEKVRSISGLSYDIHFSRETKPA